MEKFTFGGSLGSKQFELFLYDEFVILSLKSIFEKKMVFLISGIIEQNETLNEGINLTDAQNELLLFASSKNFIIYYF